MVAKNQQAILLEHLRAVLAQNKQQNLTRISSEEQGKILHIEDSLSALPEITSAPKGMLIDIGSGAGYPGIPLAVASGRQTVLVEANKNKAKFLMGFIEQHTLNQQITVINERIEEYANKGSAQAAVVTARAVAELAVLLEYAAPLVCLGGIFIAYKANPSEDELKQSLRAAELLGFSQPNVRRFYLSDNLTQRVLFQFSKTAEAKITVPRRSGMAKKRPLG